MKTGQITGKEFMKFIRIPAEEVKIIGRLEHKPLTKVEESMYMLRGLISYVKATAAEPTAEQFDKIRVSFFLAEAKTGAKTDKKRQLENYIDSLIRKLPSNNRKKQSSDLQFWTQLKSIRDDATLKTAPLSDPRRTANEFNDVVYEYITKHTLIDLESANMTIANKHRLMELCPYIRKAFMDAIERDDVSFFKKVGDVLRKRQMTIKDYYKPAYSKLQTFMIVHWAKEFDGVPPLYSQSILRLRSICQQKLNNERLTVETVEKARQRLGLFPFRKGSSKKV